MFYCQKQYKLPRYIDNKITIIYVSVWEAEPSRNESSYI